MARPDFLLKVSIQSIPTADLVATKRALRAEATRRRCAAAKEISAEQAGVAAAENLLRAVPIAPAVPVSAFWPMGDEIDPRPLLVRLLADGHPIGLPTVVRRGEPLVFRRWVPGDTLVPGGFNTQAPLPESPVLFPGLVITPLLAFDRAGYRLGYGGGFYDRTLAELRHRRPVTAVGFAFAAQEIEAVPRDGHDQPLDWIVTEREAFKVA